MPSSQPYDRRFYSVFVLELRRRGYPIYGQPGWTLALICADALAPCCTPPPPTTTARSSAADIAPLSGLPDPSPDDIHWRKLRAACDAWLTRFAPQFAGAALDYRSRKWVSHPASAPPP